MSPYVQFVDIAAACGYEKSVYVHSLEELAYRMEEWKAKAQLTFLHLKVAKGSLDKLGRPTIKPYAVKERLQVFLDD